MIDYPNDIKPLEDAGLSDAEIAHHLASRTATSMSCSSSRVALQESGVVVEDPVTGTRGGPLIDHYIELPQGVEKSLLSWYISHVFGGGDVVSTDSHPQSSRFAMVEAGLPVELAPVVAAIVASAGGRPDSETVAGDVITIRELYLLEQQTQSAVEVQENKYVTLYNQNIAPLIDSQDADDAAWQEALTSMASEWGN